MVSLFSRLHHVTQNCANFNDTDWNFLDFTNKHLFYDDDDKEHLPIMVYSGIKPSMEPGFIINTLISLGRFSTECKIILNYTLRGWFRNVKLIGEEDEPEYMQRYLNQVMNCFRQKSACVLSKWPIYGWRFYYPIWRSIG